MATMIEQNSSLLLFKDEDKSNKNYDCPFCLLHFDEPSMRKHHVLGHFLKNTCNKCDSELIKICDDWYALHPCDQMEPEIDCEPPNINFIDVKIENPCDMDDSFNMSPMNVKEEIEMMDIEDWHYSSPDDDTTVEPHLDGVIRSTESKEHPRPKKKHKKPAPLRKRQKSAPRLQYHPHRVQRNLECDICKVVIATYSSMVMHMESKHMSNEQRQQFTTCEICDKKLYTPRGVKCHMENHRRRSEFIKIEPSTSSHATIDRPPVLTPYRIFGKLGMRYDPNQSKNKFLCDKCTFTANSIADLQKHIDTEHYLYVKAYKKSKHSDSRQPPHPHRITRNLECDICKVVITKYYSMILHMESKHMPKEERKQFFTCEICQKKIFTAKGLEIHIDNHRIKAGEIEKPTTVFMCSFCGKEYTSKNSLRNHESEHTGIMHRCDKCGKEFRSRNTLKMHNKSVHLQTTRIQCQFENCKTTLCSTMALQRHCARKHGMVKNPNPCPICGKEFPDSKYHLGRHLEAHKKNTAKEYIKPTK